MDQKTFEELLKEGDLDLILMDGGKNLTKDQMNRVRGMAKEQSKERLLEMSQQLANTPGYKDFMKMPLVGSIMAGKRKPVENKKEEKPQEKSVKKTKDKPREKQSATRTKKDPKITTISAGVARPLDVNDSVANIAGKIYNFMRMDYDDYMKNMVEDKKYKEKIEKLKVDRNKELIDLFAGKKPEKKEGGEKKKEGKKEKKKDQESKTAENKAAKESKTAEKKTEVTPKKEVTKPEPKPEPVKTAEKTKPVEPKPSAEKAPTAQPAGPKTPATSKATEIGKAAAAAAAIGGLGSASAKFESNGDPSTVSSGMMAGGKIDPGGISYGTYQMSSTKGVADDFVKKSEWKKDFDGLKAGTPEFGEKWKQLAKDPKEGKKFADAQHDYIKKTHYDPAATKAKKMGFNLSDPGVADAIWSLSVQHGDVQRVLNIAKKDMGGSVSDDPKKEIEALYQARNEYTEGKFSKRYESEVKSVLDKSTGQQLNSVSIENKDLKKQAETMSGTDVAVINNNTNVVNGGDTYQATDAGPNTAPAVNKQYKT